MCSLSSRRRAPEARRWRSPPDRSYVRGRVTVIEKTQDSGFAGSWQCVPPPEAPRMNVPPIRLTQNGDVISLSQSDNQNGMTIQSHCQGRDEGGGRGWLDCTTNVSGRASSSFTSKFTLELDSEGRTLWMISPAFDTEPIPARVHDFGQGVKMPVPSQPSIHIPERRTRCIRPGS